MNLTYGMRLVPMAVLCALLGPPPAMAECAKMTPEQANRVHGQRPYSPYADRRYPARPLFGDTHLHTGMSMDAGVWGATLMPADAYRFVRGEQVWTSSGQKAKLSRPLDFLVVTDHSDNMGWVTDLFAGKPELLADEYGKKWYNMIQEGKANEAALEMIGLFSQGKFPESQLYAPGTPGYLSAWEETAVTSGSRLRTLCSFRNWDR